MSGEEAACSGEGTGNPVNQPPPRQLRVVQEDTGGIQSTKTLRVLARICLVLAGIIFFCQVSVAFPSNFCTAVNISDGSK